MKILPVTRNFFLWQEISSCNKKFLDIIEIFLWQQISYCKKFLTVARNFFLWQDISSWGKCLFVIILLHQKITSFCKKAFVWQELVASFCSKHFPVTKTREFLETFRASLKISWEPGSLAPGEYPTLFIRTGLISGLRIFFGYEKKNK